MTDESRTTMTGPSLGDALRHQAELPYSHASTLRALAAQADRLERERDEARAQVERVEMLLHGAPFDTIPKATLRAALADPEARS